MKKSHIFLVLVALVMVFGQSCKKKDDPIQIVENQDLLGVWKATNVLEGSLDVTSEYSNYLLTFADDLTTKSYVLVDRLSTSSKGTWSISTDKTTITLTPESGTAKTISAVSFSATELKYTSEETGKSGQVTLSFTLTKQ